jgi:hypothetical protein
MDGLRDNLNDARSECRDRHAHLKDQIQQTDSTITKTAEAIEAGSVRLRTFGFVCVLAGSIFTTWAPELASSLWGTAVMPALTVSGWAFAWTRRPASGGR